MTTRRTSGIEDLMPDARKTDEEQRAKCPKIENMRKDPIG